MYTAKGTECIPRSLLKMAFLALEEIRSDNRSVGKCAGRHHLILYSSASADSSYAKARALKCQHFRAYLTFEWEHVIAGIHLVNKPT